MDILYVSRLVFWEVLSLFEILGVIMRKICGGMYFNDKIGMQLFFVMFVLVIDNFLVIIEVWMVLEFGFVMIVVEKINEDEFQCLQKIIDDIVNSIDNFYGEVDKEFY